MNINLHNYEAYFLDHIEGNLTEEQETELNKFLEEHPELKAELDGFEPLQLQPSSGLAMPDSEKMKKQVSPTSNITADNYENYLVAELENDLDEAEKEELLGFLDKNKFTAVERKLFQQTKIAANKEVVFPEKESLKKSAAIISLPGYAQQMIAVAAGLALFISLWFIALNKPEHETLSYQLRESKAPLTVDTNIVMPTFYTVTTEEKTATKSVEKQLEERPHNQQQENNNQEPQKTLSVLEKDTIQEKAPIKLKEEHQFANQLKQLALDSSKTEMNELETANTLANKNTDTEEGDDYLTVGQWLAKLFKKNVLEEEDASSEVKPVDIAQAGAKGMNKMLGTKWGVNKQYNQEGELVAYSFNAGKIGFTRNVKQKTE